MRSASEPTSAARRSTADPDSPDSAEDPLPDDDSVDFTALVARELGWVWRLLRRIGLSAADADDAAQQVFFVAAQKRDQLEPGKARSFLYGTALRVAANVRRSLRRRRELHDEVALAEPPHIAAQDELLDQQRARALVDELLAELSDDLRRVLVLAEIEQLSAPRIAELEGIPLGTVASRLRRARSRFYELLEARRARDGEGCAP
ncbi:MAG: sigma-70 family RNA polymerase sigma factor [Polyangiaceae bacterium]